MCAAAVLTCKAISHAKKHTHENAPQTHAHIFYSRRKNTWDACNWKSATNKLNICSSTHSHSHSYISVVCTRFEFTCFYLIPFFHRPSAPDAITSSLAVLWFIPMHGQITIRWMRIVYASDMRFGVVVVVVSEMNVYSKYGHDENWLFISKHSFVFFFWRLVCCCYQKLSMRTEKKKLYQQQTTWIVSHFFELFSFAFHVALPTLAGLIWNCYCAEKLFMKSIAFVFFFQPPVRYLCNIERSKLKIRAYW